MAGEAGGAGSNSSHQLAAFRASQSLADAQAERTISSGDQQGVGEQHNRRADHRVLRRRRERRGVTAGCAGEQEGYRAKPDQEQGVLLLGEQLVAVCDHFHRC